jgi:hypothetical protein
VYGVFDGRGGSVWFEAEGWVDLLLKVLVYHAAFVISRVIAVAEDTTNVA